MSKALKDKNKASHDPSKNKEEISLLILEATPPEGHPDRAAYEEDSKAFLGQSDGYFANRRRLGHFADFRQSRRGGDIVQILEDIRRHSVWARDQFGEKPEK